MSAGALHTLSVYSLPLSAAALAIVDVASTCGVAIVSDTVTFYAFPCLASVM